MFQWNRNTLVDQILPIISSHRRVVTSSIFASLHVLSNRSIYFIGTFLRTVRTEMCAIKVCETRQASLLLVFICIPTSRTWHDTTRHATLHKYKNTYLRRPLFVWLSIGLFIVSPCIFFRCVHMIIECVHAATYEYSLFTNISASQRLFLKNRRHNFRGIVDVCSACSRVPTL